MKADPRSAETITVRASPELLNQLDEWRNAQPVPPTRSDVVRVAVMQWLRQQATFSKGAGGTSG